jgi:hypothetical protein
MPVNTNETKIYKAVQTNKEVIIAKGTSFLGLIASPACVDTASKPT